MAKSVFSVNYIDIIQFLYFHVHAVQENFVNNVKTTINVSSRYSLDCRGFQYSWYTIA